MATAKDEIVISGIAGQFPKSKNVQHFANNLLNSIDMVTENHQNHLELPTRNGTIFDVDKFDAGFFGLHYRQAQNMDPIIRLLLERSIEAILDAGINPKELEGTKTGVFVARSWSDKETDTLLGITEPQQFALTGYQSSLIAQRISYFLKLNGSSFTVDTACSSSLNALDSAVNALRLGHCENAIVGCANLLLHPGNTLQFYRLGTLSPDGKSKSFDHTANGYVRSETIASIFLQKAQNARRVYAQIIDIKMSVNGFTEQGINSSSSQMQAKLITEIYAQNSIDLSLLSLVEAHGTGTKVGDLQEIQAIDLALAQKRTKPLLVGSVKSNIGHTEPSSGLASIIKVLIAFETGLIAPNLHFTKAKPEMLGLQTGRLKIVQKLTQLKSENALVGINNFGFGGSNGHAILQRFAKPKKGSHDEVPRLVCVSGRTKKAVTTLLEQCQKFDLEYIGLLHQIFKTEVENHLYRGYSIVSKNGQQASNIVLNSNKPFWVYFGSFVNSYKALATFLGQSFCCQKTCSRINTILNKNGLKNFEETSQVLASICVQILIVDLLEALNLVPEKVYGESTGLIAYAYYQKQIDLETSIEKAINFRTNGVRAKTWIPTSQMVLNFSDHDSNGFSNNLGILQTLGKLYQKGCNLNLAKLYQPIEFPVSRGTQMISPLIKWNHGTSWYTFKFNGYSPIKLGQEEYEISLIDDEYRFISGHVIDGRNLFPAAEYLHLVWKTFAKMHQLLPQDLPVIFKNCKFIKAISIASNGSIKLMITIQKSGNFEIVEKDSVIVKGTIESGIEEEAMETVPINTKLLEPKEIYQELRLRGYNYSGSFKAIKSCDIDTSFGEVEWNNNWTTFIDALLQLKILQNDTRLLFVPVGIKKISINPVKHKQRIFPVHISKSCNIIKSGGIKIVGLATQSISKRKLGLKPVLEKYVFVPNKCALNLVEAIRVDVQLIVENTIESKFKAIEISTSKNTIMPFVAKALDDIPLVTPNLKTVATIKDVCENNYTLIITTKNVLEASKFLSKNGFLLIRQKFKFQKQTFNGFDIVTEFDTGTETVILLQKTQINSVPVVIEVSSKSFEWLSELKTNLKKNLTILLHDNEINLGLITCLRRESNGHKIRYFSSLQNGFDIQNQKNLAINVFKNNSWGTYRHLELQTKTVQHCEHHFATVNKGDLSSFKWCKGILSPETPLKPNQIMIRTHYAGINFKDIMAASGRVNIETLYSDRLQSECLIGCEFSGETNNGRRLIGMVSNQAFSSYVIADKNFSWQIPDTWSLEDGATVPIVYLTVLYALFVIADLKPKQSILIHSATGGVGLAAINVCRHFKCNIFVTVGTSEKVVFLKENFPEIPESHIGNSRDCSFEELIQIETENCGVDIVLNSLTDEKLKASIRCLARGGCFLEIGKFDLGKDTSLELLLLEKGASYHGIMIDRLYQTSEDLKERLVKILEDGICDGFVKPLPKTVFDKIDIEKAFRYMTTGKHIGKVVLKIKGQDSTKFKIYPKFCCYTDRAYVIIGGLGGIGLELADWLVLRGARHLIFISRSNVQTAYQLQRLRLWTSYGVQVVIKSLDLTNLKQCFNLVQESSVPIDAIFNLAAILKDALLEDQTEEAFQKVLAPKALITQNLDQVTRQLCPGLRYFVVFSSVSCGRGNLGQSNYGMANSLMERVCEKRAKDGFPATAIQWGAIGDVGMVAKMRDECEDLVICGTAQQKVGSCLEVLDTLLGQNEPIVASTIVAKNSARSLNSTDAADVVATILGIRDVKSVSQHTSLSELGMDSMVETELLRILEKDFDFFTTSKDVRKMTLANFAKVGKSSK